LFKYHWKDFILTREPPFFFNYENNYPHYCSLISFLPVYFKILSLAFLGLKLASSYFTIQKRIKTRTKKVTQSTNFAYKKISPKSPIKFYFQKSNSILSRKPWNWNSVLQPHLLKTSDPHQASLFQFSTRYNYFHTRNFSADNPAGYHHPPAMFNDAWRKPEGNQL